MESMCLYDFVGAVYKIVIPKAECQEVEDVFEGTEQRFLGRLSSPLHPQYLTHRMKVRNVQDFRIPVILGNTLPRPDRDDSERCRWARAMLTLFKPWRE